MPKRDSSSENALTIISTSRELSPKARQMLAEGSRKGSQELQTFFEGTYFQSEYKKLPVEEAEALSDDLHNSLEILKPLLEILEESRRKGVYPPYAQAIELVLQEAYEKLSSWRCFEGWGMSVAFGDESFSLLPLPRTDAASRKCTGFHDSIERSARSGMLSLVDSHMLWELANRTSNILCIISDITPPKQGMLSWGRRNETEDKYLSSMNFEEDVVNIENRHFKGGTRWGVLRSQNKHRVTFQDMVLLVTGLMDDVLAYSKLVKGEHSAGQSFIQSLRTLMGR